MTEKPEEMLTMTIERIMGEYAEALEFSKDTGSVVAKMYDLITSAKAEGAVEALEKVRGLHNLFIKPETHHPPRCIMESDIDKLISEYKGEYGNV